MAFAQRIGKDEQAMIQVINPYVQWALDNGMTSISLGEEQRRLENNGIFTNSISPGTSGRI